MADAGYHRGFMSRPTEVLVSYLAEAYDLPRPRVERLLRPGRIAMALEIITVVRLLEEHELLAEREETISTLLTLLQDQDLAHIATQWYEMLNEWRKPKFAAENDALLSEDPSPPSGREAPPDAPAPGDSTDAPLGSDQTKDPPSSE